MQWRTDMENAPTDTPHLRGTWVVHSSTKQPLFFEANSGFVDDDGDFVNFDNEPFGWRPEDYSHWAPLPETPTPPIV